MAEINLTQTEANHLIEMEKHRVDEAEYEVPNLGKSLSIALQSTDKREQFILDISSSRIDLQRGKYQNRGRQVVPLVRLDFGGPPHRNPDDGEITSPHLHIYREGFGDKWAYPVPHDHFPRLEDLRGTLDDFMRYCNITQPPHFERGLFG